jgi:hypothetical protein
VKNASQKDAKYLNLLVMIIAMEKLRRSIRDIFAVIAIKALLEMMHTDK